MPSGYANIPKSVQPTPAAAPTLQEQPRYPWPWAIMSTPAIRALARRIKSSTAVRLFLILPSYLDWEEWRMLRQADLADEIASDPANVSRALRELLDLKVIVRRGKGPRQEWRLSLDFGWKGNLASFVEEAARQGKTVARDFRGLLHVAEEIVPAPTTTTRQPPNQKGNTTQPKLPLVRLLPGRSGPPATQR